MARGLYFIIILFLFVRSEKISRENDVTIVLALNRIAFRYIHV